MRAAVLIFSVSALLGGCSSISLDSFDPFSSEEPETFGVSIGELVVNASILAQASRMPGNEVVAERHSGERAIALLSQASPIYFNTNAGAEIASQLDRGVATAFSLIWADGSSAMVVVHASSVRPDGPNGTVIDLSRADGGSPSKKQGVAKGTGWSCTGCWTSYLDACIECSTASAMTSQEIADVSTIGIDERVILPLRRDFRASVRIDCDPALLAMNSTD